VTLRHNSISLGSSLFSTRAGRAKAIYNQLLTGNISCSTLLMFLGGHADGERISAAAHPQWTLFAKAKQKWTVSSLFSATYSSNVFFYLWKVDVWIGIIARKSPLGLTTVFKVIANCAVRSQETWW